MADPSPSSDPSDESLMQRFARGDAGAFEVLYDRHHMGTWRFIFRSVRIQAVADDLLQDVWFSVARSAASYVPSAKFRTWLFTMAHNRVVDYARANKNTLSLDGQSGAGDGPSPLSDYVPELFANSGFGPMQQLQSKEQALSLLQAIEQLPTEQREAFLLQVEAEMSVTEIAEATGVSFETAKSRLRYARNRLRETLQEYCA